MAEQYFHLTIGPVQAFVAQARRTRDFWAGSFILSYLSSVAMAAVTQQQGEVEFPVPDQNFSDWLEGACNDPAKKPLQGSVPNRFKAMNAKVQPGFDPVAVVNAVQTAWKAIADLVWRYDLKPVCGNDSEQALIWKRQIEQFWEISWCLTEDGSATNLLDRRKNWREHRIDDEPGVKCSLMEGYQELSGSERPGEAVRNFWRKVRESDKTLSLARDLREDEHLCAIAMVKRRFVHYFAELEVTLPSINNNAAKTLQGWKLPASVPSIAYLAAAPWLAATIGAVKSNPDVLIDVKQLQAALEQLDVPWEGKVLGNIQQAADRAGLANWRWQQVNGQYLYEPAVQQMRKDVRRDSLLNDDAAIYEAVLKHLRNIRKKTGLGEPSPFYAILLMDGDSLGAQMSDPAKQKGISSALNAFTRGVPDIVEQYSGFLVYAGGDDVLALLPQPFAIACASAIRQHYDQCFIEVNKNQGNAPIQTSISAAIEFAHYKTPLTRILQDAHDLLDSVAKDETGRNSLAIRVWKPGGLHAQWSSPWTYASDLTALVSDIAQHLGGDLSRSFFFKLEDIIRDLGLADADGQHGFDETIIQSLVRSAWAHTGNKLDSLPTGLEQRLLNACRRVTRGLHNGHYIEKADIRFMPGALRLIQFLASENQSFLSATAVDCKGDAA